MCMHEHYFLTTQNRFGSQSWSNFGVMWKPETSILDLSEVDDILCPKIKLSINKYLHCHIFWIFQWGRNSWCNFNNISKVICGKKKTHFRHKLLLKAVCFYTPYYMSEVRVLCFREAAFLRRLTQRQTRENTGQSRRVAMNV